ncbi:GNAT family N-acetyltransferase [uncultured Piscinibacter sp.]|uniref:GNAT family N-acetyltransferase n=1 Tax=uncultured Piscinibacter sp. TaxID=1131835 RepID=UPI0026114B2D|nr:GNAT family N-acetyltransferase [uncultured Piscinibacter sp.]
MSLDTLDALSTDRLVIRPVDDTDIADLLAVNGDAEVVRHLPCGAWRSLADGQAWLGRMRALQDAGTGRQFVLVSRGEGRAIGTVLLFRHEPSSARAEVGYVLGRAHWGRGLMRETLRAFCKAAFMQVCLHRIEAEALPENQASNRLLASLGFTLEGRLRQRWRTEGGGRDVNHWGLLIGELR